MVKKFLHADVRLKKTDGQVCPSVCVLNRRPNLHVRLVRQLWLSVADDLVDLIAETSDPAVAWKTLKEQFNSGDQSPILTLMGQLHSLKLNEGDAVEDYVKKARELKSRLTSVGERLSDHNFNQIVMNGLPRSYESTIQTLQHLDLTMTFDKLSANLLLESHRRKHREQVLGNEVVLLASYQRHVPTRPPNQGYGRGRWPPNYRGRGFPGSHGIPGQGYYGSPRPLPICFNCGKPGHLARDCQQPKNSYAYPDQNEQKSMRYANSPEMFDYQLEQDWYDPYYNYWGNGPWYLDSGASNHIAADSDKLDHPPTSSGVEIREIKTRGGESHPVQGTGTATVQINNGAIKLKSVKYVPSMTKNLISVGAIADTGHRIMFSSRKCWVIDNKGIAIASGHRDPFNGLYSFQQKATALSSEH